MEIIYRAYDGEEFDNEKGCKFHELNNAAFTMFNKYGKKTTDIDCCYLLYISKYTENVDEFFENNNVNFSGYINEGWFFWDKCSDQFVECSNLIPILEVNCSFKFNKAMGV